MVLDEPKESDNVFNIDEFTMVMDKGLLEQTKSVIVDYVHNAFGGGFKLSSQIPVGGGSCSPSCSC